MSASLASHAARGAAATLTGQWARFCIQLAAMATLARLLDPQDYGMVGMIMAIVGVATLLGDFGLSAASIQVQESTDQQRSNLFWINCAAGVVLSIGVFLLSAPIASFYGQPALADMTKVIALVFLVNAVAAQFRAEISRNFQFTRLAGADVSAQVAGAAVGITMAILDWGYWALVYQQVTVAVVTAAVTILSARWWPRLPRRGASIRPFLSFGLNTTGVQLINYASSNVDSVLIGRFWGSVALGYYDRAYQIFRLPMQQIAAPMTRVALPVLSKIQTHDSFEPYVARAQIVLAYGMGGAFFFAAGVADPLIRLVLGDQWAASTVIFQILAIGGVFQSLAFTYHWIFLAKGMTGVQLRYTIVTRTLMVGLMAVGVVWGPIGVALGSSIGLALNWSVLTWLAIPRTGVRAATLATASIRPVLVMGGIGATLLAANALLPVAIPLVRLAILGAIGVVLLGGCALLIRPVRRDLLAVWDTAKRMKK